MILLNFDKRLAEWQVVAYLSNDENMLRVVREGLDAHSYTGFYMTNVPVQMVKRDQKLIGELSEPNEIAALRKQHLPELFTLATFLPRSMSIRQAGKKANHGLNYDEGPRTFSIVNEMELADAERVWKLYRFKAYPGLPAWHESIQQELRDNDRTLFNCFGRKCYFMDAWGDDMFKKGYAFKPQSTVGDMVNQGMTLAMNDDADYMEDLQFLSQVHDSGVFQYPLGDWRRIAQACVRVGLEHFSPEIEYSGHKFKIATDLKIGANWGHMAEVALTEDIDEMARRLEDGWEKLHERKAA